MYLFIALLVALSASAADPQVLGRGVTVRETIPVKALLIDPERYVGSTVVVRGLVAAVEEGEPRRIRIADLEGGRSVRFQLPSAGFPVPPEAVGREILAEGEFLRIEPRPGRIGYVISGTGAILY